MKSHFSEDTDEENYDDPIKLFDNNINAVYFGSQPYKRCIGDTESCWTFETIGNNEFCQPSENSIFGRPDDVLVQTSQSGTTSECDMSPLCVKLVDCGKFPWYYRKYTQQIIHKLNLNENSDHDTDVEVIVDDSDDCFVVEDLQDVVTNNITTNDQICINTMQPTEPKPKLPKIKLKKSLDITKRHKDDKEIQRALSSKNLVKVDLRRNQGLIGMKITQKVETNTMLDAKTDKDLPKNITQKIGPNTTLAVKTDKDLAVKSTQKIETINATLEAKSDKDLAMKITQKVGTNTSLAAKTDKDLAMKSTQKIETINATLEAKPDHDLAMKITQKIGTNTTLEANTDKDLAMKITRKIGTNTTLAAKTQKDLAMNITQKIGTNTTLAAKTQKDLAMKITQKIETNSMLAAKTQKDLAMKITQNIGTNTTLDAKTNKDFVVEEADATQKCAIADEKYLSAADKTLCHIGTQLIPIKKEKESNSICQFNIDDKEKDLFGKPTPVKSSSFQNITVQFDISKISEKLIDNLKIKKINDQSSEAKLISKQSNKSISNDPENTFKTVNEKELNSKVTIPEKCANSSKTVTSHVKDVKKTNKYRNDRIKIENSARHRSLIGLLVTNKSKEDVKEIKCMKQKKHKDNTQNKATKLDKKPRKKIEKQKREPKSPILHCSTVLKKPKQHGIPPKCNKIDTNSNISKEPGKLKQIVDKLSNLNRCNLMQNTDPVKHVIPKIAPVKPFDVHTKQALQKESCMVQDETVSQVKSLPTAKPLSVSDKVHKKSNEISKADFKTNFHNTQIMSLSQNKTLNEQNVLHETLQHKLNKHTMNAASVRNPTPKVPIKNNKPIISNSNVSTTAVVTPASGSNTVFSNQYAHFSTHRGPHFPMYEAGPSKMSSSNNPNNNINVPVQNRYASAIILKSNNHANSPFEKYCEPPVQTMAFQRPMTVLRHKQLRSRDPPLPYPIFYPPAPFSHSYFPSSANSVGNQFHPPQSHIGQPPSNPMQNFYRECWLSQNLVPPPPPPPPVPPVNFPPRNGHVVNQSKDCSNLNSTSAPVVQNLNSVLRHNCVNIQQTKNSSIIGINNDGLVKKINIIAMPAKNVNTTTGTIEVEQIKAPKIMSPVEHTKVVATKTEMLKELDKLSFIDESINEFKRVYPGSVINENKKENTLEVAIMSKNSGKFDTLKLTVNRKDDLMQTKPAQGYSPPILPIPTYQQVLDRVTSNLQTQDATPNIALHPEDPRSNLKNECKPMRKRDFVKCCKRKLNNAWNNDEDSRRKEDAKKISIEEYKKRILKTGCKSEHYKKICKEKYDNSGKQPNVDFKYRNNVDGTETDLGYDSDSTVVL